MPAISSTLPLPISVAGSAFGLRWTISAAISAPAESPARETPRVSGLVEQGSGRGAWSGSPIISGAGYRGVARQDGGGRQLTPLRREVDGNQQGAFGGLVDGVQYSDKKACLIAWV